VVLLTVRLTRDSEMRSLASGNAVTQFSVATNEYIGQGKGNGKAEYQFKGGVQPSSYAPWDSRTQARDV